MPRTSSAGPWRRRSLLIGLGLAVAVGAVGCGSSDSGSSSGSTPAGTAAGPSGDITFYAVVNDNFTKAFWGEQIAKFEAKYPQVNVKLIDSAGQDYDGYAKTLIASGQFPDVAHNLGVNDYVKQGLLKPYEITEQVKQFRGWENLQNGGKLYYLPTAVQPQSLIFYNKDDFAAAGIAATPKTLDELNAAMAKLKSAGKQPLMVTGEWTTGVQYSLFAAPTVFGGDPAWYAKRSAGQAKFADSPWQRAAEYLDEWNKAGYFGKSALSKTYDQGLKDFLGGKASMYPMGVWVTANAVSTPPKFNIGVFPVPTQDGKANVSVSYGLKYTVSAKSKAPEAATAFATFMATDPAVVGPTLKADGLLSNATTPVTYEQTPLQEEVSALLASATLVPNDSGAGDAVPVKGLGEKLNEVAQGILLGKTDAAGAMQTLDKYWDSNS